MIMAGFEAEKAGAALGVYVPLVVLSVQMCELSAVPLKLLQVRDCTPVGAFVDVQVMPVVACVMVCPVPMVPLETDPVIVPVEAGTLSRVPVEPVTACVIVSGVEVNAPCVTAPATD